MVKIKMVKNQLNLIPIFLNILKRLVKLVQYIIKLKDIEINLKKCIELTINLSEICWTKTFSPISFNKLEKSFCLSSENKFSKFIQNFIFYFIILNTFFKYCCFFHKILNGNLSSPEILVLE